MAWIYLIAAGFMEIGWPIGLKMAQQEGTRAIGIVVAIAFMAISGFLLWLAQRGRFSSELCFTATQRACGNTWACSSSSAAWSCSKSRRKEFLTNAGFKRVRIRG